MSFGEILLVLRNVFVPDLWRFVNVAVAIKNRKSLVSALSVVCHDYLLRYATQKTFCVIHTRVGVCFKPFERLERFEPFETDVIAPSRNPSVHHCIRGPTRLRNPAAHSAGEYRRRCRGRNRCAARGERIRAEASAVRTSSNWRNSCPSTGDNIPTGLPAVRAERPG